MDLENFDKKIKSSLENLEVPYDGASWDQLSSKLDASFSEEVPPPVEKVDLVVKRSLERMEVAYQPGHWNILNTQLNNVALIRRIRVSKLAEVAIFLLLLLNIEGLLGGFDQVLKPTEPVIPKSTLPMASADGQGKQTSKYLQHQKASNAGLANRVVAFLSSPVLSAVVSSTPNTIVLPSVNLSKSVLDPSNFYQNNGLVPFNKIAPLPKAKVPDFAWQNLYEIIPGVTVPVPSKASGLYAATYASFDKNHFSSGANSVRSNGFGGGIAIGYRKGKWGVESGLAYASKEYAPPRSVVIYAGNEDDGYLGAYVRDISADVFSIPVKATRRLSKLGAGSVHAVAGITANVMTEKRLTYNSVVIPSTSPSPDPIAALNPSLYPIPKTNNDGFFEGGPLSGNAFVSADLGVRVEHPIGRRYVAFVEPSYKHTVVGGFGPNKDQVNSFSLQAGILATL